MYQHWPILCQEVSSGSLHMENVNTFTRFRRSVILNYVDDDVIDFKV